MSLRIINANYLVCEIRNFSTKTAHAFNIKNVPWNSNSGENFLSKAPCCMTRTTTTCGFTYYDRNLECSNFHFSFRTQRIYFRYLTTPKPSWAHYKAEDKQRYSIIIYLAFGIVENIFGIIFSINIHHLRRNQLIQARYWPALRYLWGYIGSLEGNFNF